MMNMFDPTLVHEWLTRSANKHPDKIALIFEDRKISYKELDQLATNFALQLMHLGVKRHDRVVIFLDNSPEVVIGLYGILKAGATFVILNGALKAPKLKYIMNDSGSNVLLTHIQKSKSVELAFPDFNQSVDLIWVGDKNAIPTTLQTHSHQWDQFIAADSTIASQYSFPRIIDADLATLIYTSGSTGEPKGVMSSHHNMNAAARSIIQYLENQPDDIVIDVLPLSFDYGLYQVIMGMMFGGTIVLEKTFMFPIQILKKIEKERVTGFPIVPTIVAMLLKMTDLSKFDLSSLRYISNTGAALPVEHIRKFRALFPNVRIYSMYGLTECKRVAYLPPDQIDKKPGSVGIPMNNCEVFVVDENRKEVSPGKIGELVIRGTNVMRGYWNAPELTANVYQEGLFPGETLLYSGDLFKRDEDGYIYFVGRRDDMIKTKGERVSPKEIENIISQLDEIQEVAVIGVPDETIGKAIKAFIVMENGKVIDEKSILKFCSDNMEIFMVPKYIEFINELPKTPNGKIDKKALSQRP